MTASLFFSQHGIVRKDAHHWRIVVNQPSGEINGLPTSRGVARVTNGILVIIEQPNGELFEGHLDFFIKDEKPRAPRSGGQKLPNSALATYLNNLLAG